MIKFLCAVVAGVLLALLINVYMQSNKLTEATVKVVEQKQTVQPKQDYRMDRLRIIRDTKQHVVCFYDNYKAQFINCVMY